MAESVGGVIGSVVGKIGGLASARPRNFNVLEGGRRNIGETIQPKTAFSRRRGIERFSHNNIRQASLAGESIKIRERIAEIKSELKLFETSNILKFRQDEMPQDNFVEAPETRHQIFIPVFAEDKNNENFFIFFLRLFFGVAKWLLTEAHQDVGDIAVSIEEVARRKLVQKFILGNSLD